MGVFRKGTDNDFERWIRDYHGVLYKHALWMTGSSDVAADMAQETFFHAWSQRHALHDADKALAWLLTILRRCIYREHRYCYRQRETLEELKILDQESNAAEPGSLLQVYQAMASLSPNHRDVFLLYHLHGFSYEEIGAQLEIPTGTVMSRLARAREALSNQDNKNGNLVFLTDKFRETGSDG